MRQPPPQHVLEDPIQAARALSRRDVSEPRTTSRNSGRNNGRNNSRNSKESDLPSLLTQGRHTPGRYAFMVVALVSLAAFFAIFEAARAIGPVLPRADVAGRFLAADRPALPLAAATWSAPQATPMPPQAAQPTAAPPAQPTVPAPTPTPAAGATPTPTTTGERIHVVQAGDTLWSLAQRYDSTVEAIVAANNLTDRSATLRIGQTLIIPRSRR
jgi:nucleoid-associated protein YgaU